jgi:cytochrome P450
VRRLPPLPRGLLIIGNLHQVGALPHRTLRALAASNGVPDLMRLRLGQVEALVASSPAAAAALMREHDDVFATRPYFRTADILTYGFRDLVFAPHGVHWRHVRRLCSAHVLSGARSHAHNAAREQEVAALARAIRDQGAAVVDVSEALYGFANEVICRAVSGRVSSDDDGERKSSRSRLFRELIEENTALLGGFCVGDFFPSLAWVDDALSGAGARARWNLKRWDDLLEEVAQEHEARRVGDDDSVEDFVDVLLHLQAQDHQDGFVLTRDIMKSLLADMFAAGTETSFIALEWAMAELVRNPAAMETLQREVRAVAAPSGGMVVSADALGAAKTPYLRAVVKETLRLHPPVPLLIPRECARDVTVLGLHVAKGTRVFVNAWAVNRDPAAWRAPEEFRPERFLTEEESGEVDFRGAHLQFVPFGAGRRVCPGMQFALATIELALASLVRAFDWELPGGTAPGELDMDDAPGLTTRRRVPLWLVAKPVGW